MADAAVEFLLENLKQLLLDHARLIKGARSQLRILENDLRLFKAFLEDHSTTKRNKNKALKELMREIREVVYEAEDIVDAFVIQAAEKDTGSFFTRRFRDWLKRLSLGKKIKAICPKVNQIHNQSRLDFTRLQIGSVSDAGMEHKELEQIKVSGVREDNVVGFEGEAQNLIRYLREKIAELDVISIVGMPGLGKTTLAGKVFRDQKIQYEFPTRIWVSISQEYSKKDVFLAIMSNLINQYCKTDSFLDVLRRFINVRVEDDDMILKSKVEKKTDDELAQMVRQCLQNIKFLIVMDDIWTAEDWNDLEVGFPKFDTTGKILITSRDEKVARQANRSRDPYRLRLLTREESWELLQLEAFGKPECHRDLEELGKHIAEQCRGMPLAIVVIGGILVQKAMTRDVRAMRKAWRKVSESMTTYINEDKRMESIIALSYDKLPYHLRLCFLYLGMFPEDFEIPVWELINMWIAEGFVEQKKGISLEETAGDYLEELINRNLVMVDKLGIEGNIKTCRIHDMLRDFCQNEAGSDKENLFQEVKKSGAGDFEPSITEIKKSRRLCIHTNVLSFISSKPTGPRVRSFLCYSREEITLPCEEEKESFIPATFKLLRVLDVKPFKFMDRIPYDLTQLVHLRYITLSWNLEVLPEAFSKLWNLQTLIVYSGLKYLEIKADIWNMTQLRHVKTNAIANLPKPANGAKQCENLQTLGAISPKSCTNASYRMRSLRKLGIWGPLAELSDIKGLEKLDNLEKLKLSSYLFFYELPCCLPQPYEFPPKLRSLTLYITRLDWSQMSTLAKLNTLEVLKLKYNAFLGRCWEATDEVFQRLEILHMGVNLATWKASAHHFPRLECLVIRNCYYLEEIPPGLCENLQRLYLKHVSRSIAASAWKIKQTKTQQHGEETSGSSGFKLFIEEISSTKI